MADKAKMNETFLKYMQIKETIPNAQNKVSDDKLKIGSQVTNLVVDLNKDTVFSITYPDYYGENRSKTSGWYCSGSKDMELEKTLSITINVNNLTEDESVIKENDIFTVSKTFQTEAYSIPTQDPNQPMEFYRFTDVIMPIGYNLDTRNTSHTIVSSGVWEEDAIETSNNLTEIDFCVASYAMVPLEEPSSSSINLRVTSTRYWTINKKISLKKLLNEYDFTGYELHSLEITNKNNIFESFEYKYNKDYDVFINMKYDNLESNTAYPKMKNLVPNIALELEMKITIRPIESYYKTTQYGTLFHEVDLEPNTSYVLQVIDAFKPVIPKEKDIDLDENNNKIIDSTVRKNSIQSSVSSEEEDFFFNFDQYLFFKTDSLKQDDRCKLEIDGLSFGYKIYDLQEKVLTQMRSITTEIEPKVFLFKSDSPWIVDRNGVIVGLNPTFLQSGQEASETGLDGSLTKEEIKNIFTQKPELVLDETSQELHILLPEANLTDEMWKYYPLINATKQKDYPAILDNLVLLVYRDFLIPTERKYNDQSITMERALIRTLQRTNTSVNDKYSNATNELSEFKIKTKHPTVSFDENTKSIVFPFKTGTTEIVPKFSSDEEVEISLAILSLFGYNHNYCLQNDLLNDDYGNLPYKYTSFRFAWGYKDGDSLKRLSDFSDLIIVDRQAAHITEKDNLNYLLTLQNCKLQKKNIDGYYNSKVICLE